jgi:hypothetical protein
LSVFEIFGLQKPSDAVANAQPQNALAQERLVAYGGKDQAMPASEYAKSYDLNDGREASAVQPAPEFQDSARPSISGWRRSARRKKALLRSHT